MFTRFLLFYRTTEGLALLFIAYITGFAALALVPVPTEPVGAGVIPFALLLILMGGLGVQLCTEAMWRVLSAVEWRCVGFIAKLMSA